MFGPTSRRSRECYLTRHDVAERLTFQLNDFGTNVATLQRGLLFHVATLILNVVTFSRGIFSTSQC